MSLLLILKQNSPRYALLLWIWLGAAMSPQALAKKDLFSSEPVSTQAIHEQNMIAASSETEIDEPLISSTEAALRAQQYTQGKVMNVRQFQDENKTLYGVKLLLKNGRMKTINIDANNGNIVE